MVYGTGYMASNEAQNHLLCCFLKDCILRLEGLGARTCKQHGFGMFWLTRHMYIRILLSGDKGVPEIIACRIPMLMWSFMSLD